MAETPQELAERLKALNQKTSTASTTPSFVAPTESTVTSDGSASAEGDLNTKSPDGGSDNPELKNLIEMATKANEALNNKTVDFGAHEARVRAILNGCGMDSQMVERAVTLLKEL